MSSASFYAWKAKYSGRDVSDARKLKGLEDENGKLKKLLADALTMRKNCRAAITVLLRPKPSTQKVLLRRQRIFSTRKVRFVQYKMALVTRRSLPST